MTASNNSLTIVEQNMLIYPQNISGCKNVLLIDNQVKDPELFMSSANADTLPIIYSSQSNKGELLTLLQTKFTSIERFGIVFTNDFDPFTTIFLDNQPFFHTTDLIEPPEAPYNNKSENVEFIISTIKTFGVKNIDYLACDTLNYPEWVDYYKLITKETSITIGASNDKTGNIKYGGDWIMESTSEDIEMVYFNENIEYYKYLLGLSSNHTLILKTDGTIYGCGKNSNGQLGNGVTINGSTSILSLMTAVSGRTPKYISGGENHTIVLMTDGTIYGCGLNNYGQLGLSAGNYDTSKNILTQMDLSGAIIGGGVNKTPKYIACGYNHTVVLMTDGTIYGCGRNINGQLGISAGNRDTSISILTQMDLSGNVIGTGAGKKTPKYIAGGSVTIVLMTDGTIYGCGLNDNEQLGLSAGNYDTSKNILTQMDLSGAIIGGGVNKTPKYIACGVYHTIVLMTDGTIYGCGYNSYGQLGNGGYTATKTLTLMTAVPNRTPKYIAGGYYHTVVLMTDGTIYGCGYNTYGQLGNGVTNSTSTLSLMTAVPNRTPKYIAGGYNHTVVLMTDGTIYGCGRNINGQLGNGTTNSSSILSPMTANNNINSTSYINDIVVGFDVNNINYFPTKSDALAGTNAFVVDSVTYTIGSDGPFGGYTSWQIASNSTGTSLQNLIYSNGDILNNNNYYNLYPTEMCFLQGSTILCLVDGAEQYIPIEHLVKGTLVKTSLNGYKPVVLVGKGTIHNLGNDERTENRLYKCPVAKYPHLKDDLYITGCHSILEFPITETQKEAIINQMGRLFVTDAKYRLMACIDERAEPWNSKGEYTIWHIALENSDELMNYGIYANGGLLVETCSIWFLKHKTNMAVVG